MATRDYSGSTLRRSQRSGLWERVPVEVPPAGGSESGLPGPPLLDNIRHSCTQNAKREYRPWTRQQCRVFQRSKSCLSLWAAHGYKGLWVTLTTARGGDASLLGKHHKELLRRFERTFHYPGVEWWFIKTTEGNGVIHAFWVWKPRDGYRQRPFIVSQSWLSDEWNKIHGAYIVKPKRLHLHEKSAKGLSRYVVNQYVVNQETKDGECALAGMGWSWKRTFGFPVQRTWRHFKQSFADRPKPDLYAAWDRFLSGATVLLEGVPWSMSLLRASPALLPLTPAQESSWWISNFGPAAARWI